jgi:hypothetical protein
VSQLAPAVLADVVILNMRHLPAAPPLLGHTAADVAMPGLMALFGAPAPAPAPPPGAGPVPVSGTAAAIMAPGGAANAQAAPPAPPAPLVAQQLGTEARAAQRLAAAERIMRADERKNVTGTSHERLSAFCSSKRAPDAACDCASVWRGGISLRRSGASQRRGGTAVSDGAVGVSAGGLRRPAGELIVLMTRSSMFLVADTRCLCVAA